MWQSSEILTDLNTLTLQLIFWIKRTFLKKLEYCFLVESTKIEYISFLYKIAMSETNFKTNRMGSTERTYHKERSIASNYFIFLKILFQFKNLFNSWFDVPTTQMSIFILFVNAGVLFESALWVLFSLQLY